MAFASAPDPVSPLARYRILSPNAGVRVSPLCLGAMNLGTAWKQFMGGVEKEDAFKLLDYFYDQGGNFIDVRPQTLEDSNDGRPRIRTRTNRANCGLVNG
jgi:predicted aldo/keto reductase-like oxidoreductase